MQSNASAAWINHEVRLNTLYAEADGGWQKHEVRLNNLHEGVKVALKDLKAKVMKIENVGGVGGGQGAR